MSLSVHRLVRLAGAAGCLTLAAAFMRWFPASTWSGIPFVDDWPARFQGTVDGVHLLRHAALAGWRWEFLGGYPLADDAGQALTLWAALPIAVCGGPAGFHLTHLLIAAAIPALAWWSARVTGGRDAAWLAAGVAAIFCAGYASPLVRAGDTHVLAGAVAAFATLTAAQALRASDVEGAQGGRVPAVALVMSLTLAGLGPPAFFLYTLLLLAVDAVVARDGRSFRRAVVAAGAAVIAGLPATWDLWRYPSEFLASRPAWHPGKDAAVLVPMLAAPLLALLMVRRGRLRAVACGITLAAAIGLTARMSWQPVPHVRSARDVDASLVDRVARLDGDLVVVEDTVGAGARYAALLPAATGKRFYFGMWRPGRPTLEATASELDREMQRWGVRHVLAWSAPLVRFLDASTFFQLLEDNGRWQHYVYARPPLDPGPGRLVSYSPTGGVVRLTAAHRGEFVTIRTHFHPAWRARIGGQAIPLFDADGLLAFAAPRDGDYDVELVYPRRLGLIPAAVAAAILGMLILLDGPGGRRPSTRLGAGGQMSVRPTSVFMSRISPRRIMSRASARSKTCAWMSSSSSSSTFSSVDSSPERRKKTISSSQ